MAQQNIETGRGMAILGDLSATVNNTTSEVTLYTATIAAGKMGKNKRGMFFVDGTLTTALSLVPTLTIRVKFGSSTLAVMNGSVLAVGQNSAPFHIEGYIANLGATNSQFVWSQIQQNGQTAISAVTNWTEDTTSSKTLTITAQFSGLSVSTTYVAKYASLELT